MAITLTGCNQANTAATLATTSTINKSDSEKEYVNKLFDASYVHTINIDISDADWQDLLKNPLEETFYPCDLTIDGEKYSNVGIRTKGNSSLSQVADSDSDRYSFKINFSKYEKGQDYYGLDKLALNNLIQDTTFMKDYLAYTMMGEFGVASPKVSYSYITINGQEWGLYLNVEAIDKSFLKRNYGSDYGALYKPSTDDDNAMMPNGNRGEKQLPPDEAQPEKNNMQPGGAPDRQGGPGSKEALGADLKYVDDNYDSYSNIFDNAKTNITDEDKNTLIAALKQISEGDNLDQAIDIDATIRYFVVHNFLDNYDSYTGNMLHNYYLYEANGKISMLPWDYNLAFGAFGGGGGRPEGQNMPKPQDMPEAKDELEAKDMSQDNHNEEIQEDLQKKGVMDNSPEQAGLKDNGASNMVNMAIDTPLFGTNEENRPMWSALINNETYKEQYHTLFDEFLSNYLENGAIAKEITRVQKMLSPYIQKDPTKFYDYESFNKAVNTLQQFISLRTESIRKQLSGEIPSITELQHSFKGELVDASGINISDMGSNRGDHKEGKK